jgi:hypothetical protein
MLRRHAIAMGAAAMGTILIGARARAAMPKEFRIGLLGGENTQDRLVRYDEFQRLLSEHLRIPVTLFPAADYAGVMQGIAAGQLEAASFGASGFAGAWLDCKCIEPVVVPQEKRRLDLLLFRHGRARRFRDQDDPGHEGTFARLGRSKFDIGISDSQCDAEVEGHQLGRWRVFLQHRVLRRT